MAARRHTPERVIESGAVETEMRDDSAPADNVVEMRPLAGDQPVPYAQQADLSGPELAEIKGRNDLVDKATKRARESQEQAFLDARLSQYAQEALTALIARLIEWKHLDPTLQYRVDLDRGVVVNVPRQQQQ